MKKTMLMLMTAGSLISGTTASAVSVPASEVPNQCAWIGDARCTHTLSYSRTDGAPTITSAGTPATVAGGNLDCNNCAGDNPMTCTATLTATFTETFTASVDSSIGVGVAGIEASLKSSIGVSATLTTTYSTTCGSTAIAPGTHSAYSVYQNVTNGKSAQIVSTYTCFSTTTGGPNPPCTPGTLSQPGGTRTSTATGNVGSSSGGCTATNPGC
jgi:hypothetical protein